MNYQIISSSRELIIGNFVKMHKTCKINLRNAKSLSKICLSGKSLVSKVTAARLFLVPIPSHPDEVDFFSFGFGNMPRKIPLEDLT